MTFIHFHKWKYVWMTTNKHVHKKQIKLLRTFTHDLGSFIPSSTEVFNHTEHPHQNTKCGLSRLVIIISCWDTDKRVKRGLKKHAREVNFSSGKAEMVKKIGMRVGGPSVSQVRGMRSRKGGGVQGIDMGKEKKIEHEKEIKQHGPVGTRIRGKCWASNRRRRKCQQWAVWFRCTQAGSGAGAARTGKRATYRWWKCMWSWNCPRQIGWSDMFCPLRCLRWATV